MSIIHPFFVGNVELISNVFLAPINPGWSENGMITDKYADFFVKRAGNDVGICYVGNVALQNEWKSNANTAVMGVNSDANWKELSRRINDKGSHAGIQLAWKPTGIILQKSFLTNNLDGQLKLFREFYENFDDFESVANLFIESIHRSIYLGYSVIQLHAAHGYALSLLLSRSVSGCENPKQTKGFELIKRIVRGINVGTSVFDIRLSLYEGINDNFDELQYKTKLSELLSEMGFDIISFSNGFYNIDKTMIYPRKKEHTVILKEVGKFAREHPNILCNVAGNMEFAIISECNIPDNLTFSLGRQLIADTKTVSKMRFHMYDSIQKCSECNRCHYYSFGFCGIKDCNLNK